MIGLEENIAFYFSLLKLASKGNLSSLQKKKKTKQGNLTLLWLLHLSLVLTSLCPFTAFSVSRNNNLMQMVSAGEAVYCIIGTFAANNFCRFFLRELHRGWLRQWFILGSICQEIRCFVSSYLHLLLH